MDTWAACGLFDEHTKIVRTFSRVAGNAGGQTIPAGNGVLTCGTQNYGYRHILARHSSQWEGLAAYTGENWRDFADWAIEVTLSGPQVVSYRSSNDTFCYSRTIYLVDLETGEILNTKRPNVVVAHQSHNIITAFPPNDHCPASS